MIDLLWQAIGLFVDGFGIGIQAFISILPYGSELANIRTEVIAAVIGIPPIAFILIKMCVRFCKSSVKN